LTPAQRFTAGASPSNAVKVVLTTKADLFFGASLLGASTVNISRTATAAIAQEASFSLGSGVVSVNGGIENALLSALTGSTVSISAVDYTSLASANVDLLQYSQQLQTDLKMQGLSYNQVLSSQVTTGQALTALGQVLTTNGDPAAADITALAELAGTATIPLNQLIDLGPYGNQDHASGGQGAGIAVNALSMVNAILQLSNGTRQVQLNLGANVPGVTQTTVYLATGQRMSSSPWITITDANTVVLSTAQTRLYVDAQVAPTIAGLGVVTVNVPVYVELASAQAKLSSLTCPTATTSESVDVSAAPSLGELYVGQVDTTQLNNFTNELTIAPPTFVTSALANVGLSAPLGGCLGGVSCPAGSPSVWLANPDWQTLSFSASQIQAGTPQSVSANNVAGMTVSTFVGQMPSPNVQLLGLNLGLNLTTIGSGVASAVSGVAGDLDTSLLNPLEKLLGVQLGYATVIVNGVRCNDAALVS
jgi:uncharacterized membrane protein